MAGPRKEPAGPETRRAARGSRFAPRTVFSLSEAETIEFGRSLARQIEDGQLIVLEGDLGSGKTVFVRGLAAGLGIAPEDVWSPSFTLVHEYKGGRLPLYHVDLYRLETPEETATLGVEELLDTGAVVAVEWGERLPPVYRRDAVTVRFHDIGEGSRRIEVLVQPTRPSRARGDA